MDADLSGPDPSRGAGRADPAPPPVAPRLLSRRADPAPPLPPVQGTDEISSLHGDYAKLVSSSPKDAPDTEPGGGVRAKVRARVAAVARFEASADRDFMGSLVRAVAVLAERLDDVSARVTDLERLLQEVLDRTSEDLARVHAALGHLDDRSTAGPPAHGE